MAGLPSANLVPRSTRWLQGSYVSVHPVSCTNLGHAASSCSLAPSTGSPLLKQPPTLDSSSLVFFLAHPQHSNKPTPSPLCWAGRMAADPPIWGSAGPHRHASQQLPAGTKQAHMTASKRLSTASSLGHNKRQRHHLVADVEHDQRPCRPLCPAEERIPSKAPGSEGGAGPPERLSAGPVPIPILLELVSSVLFGAEMDRAERRHLAPKIETRSLSLCAWVALGGSCRRPNSHRQLPPYPPSGMSIMRLCFAAQPRGRRALFFLGFFNPYYFPARLKEEFFAVDIHPSTLTPARQHHGSPVENKRERERKVSARALSQGTSADRTTRARENAHLSACSTMDLAAGWGSSATPASATGRRGNAVTRLLGGPSLNSDPLLAVGADLAGRPEGPV